MEFVCTWVTLLWLISSVLAFHNRGACWLSFCNSCWDYIRKWASCLAHKISTVMNGNTFLNSNYRISNSNTAPWPIKHLFSSVIMPCDCELLWYPPNMHYLVISKFLFKNASNFSYIFLFDVNFENLTVDYMFCWFKILHKK